MELLFFIIFIGWVVYKTCNPKIKTATSKAIGGAITNSLDFHFPTDPLQDFYGVQSRIERQLREADREHQVREAKVAEAVAELTQFRAKIFAEYTIENLSGDASDLRRAYGNAWDVTLAMLDGKYGETLIDDALRLTDFERRWK